MKLIIDEALCSKHKMTITEVLLALAVRSSDNLQGELLNMQNREILVNDRGIYKVTQHWSDVLDEILSDSSGASEKTDEQLIMLAKQMREIFPQRKMLDRMGRPTPYYYRCNTSEVVRKLKKFFTIFGNIPDSDIIDATKRYVTSFHGDYTGMRLIKYFILKEDVKPSEDGTGHVEQISDLATFLENKDCEEEEVINGDSWLMTSRN